MKKIIIIFWALFLCQSLVTANEYPTINKELLKEYIDKDTEHEFFMVTIFTNGCSSINYINQNLKMVDSITDGRTRHFVAQSSSGKDRGDVLKAVVKNKNLSEDMIYLIDESEYKIFKKDAREQGMLFRNDICFECKFVDIGVTYKIIMDKEMNILYYGMFLIPNDIAAIFKGK